MVLTLVLLGAAFAGCLGPGEPGPSTNDSSTDANTGEPYGEEPFPTNPTPTTPTGDTVTPEKRECTSTTDASVSAKTPTWVIDTTMGTIRVALFCDKAPVTAQNWVNLTESGHFDGTKFHRVIQDFMNQGGDPLTKDDGKKSSWGTGGPGYTIPDEFYCADDTVSYSYPAKCEKLGLKHDTAGTLSMANTGRPNSGGSQFFLTAVPTAWLDGKHAVFGHTADQESLDRVLAINRVPTDSSDRPIEPVIIKTATIKWE